uniref:Uncharacterized protein n=1 Tax=Ganoderma boninense TaxID=34458 RepID=A0A5K1JTW1_9APHY|nr:Uncharacterized protein [Ganoderma boninense]
MTVMTVKWKPYTAGARQEEDFFCRAGSGKGLGCEWGNILQGKLVDFDHICSLGIDEKHMEKFGPLELSYRAVISETVKCADTSVGIPCAASHAILPLDALRTQQAQVTQPRYRVFSVTSYGMTEKLPGARSSIFPFSMNLFPMYPTL